MFSSVLVAVDPDQDMSLERALSVARTQIGGDAPDKSIRAISVVPKLPGHMPSDLAQYAINRIGAEAAQKLRTRVGSMSDIAIVVKHGRPADEIIDYATANDIACVIVSSHTPALKDYLLGSTAARVVRHAPCSVIVLRGED